MVDPLELVFPAEDFEGLGVAHDVGAAHVAADFAADGALADLKKVQSIVRSERCSIQLGDALETGRACWTIETTYLSATELIVGVLGRSADLERILDSLAVA